MRVSHLSGLIAAALLLPVPFAGLAARAASPANSSLEAWQSAATGLSVTHNAERKTSGLGFIIQDAGWPRLSVHGGAADTGWGALVARAGIELGSVKAPGVGVAALSGETTDWAHNELTFDYAGGQLELWASRLTPAALVNTGANAVVLFSGNVARSTTNGTTVTDLPAGLAYPKYAAWMNSGAAAIATLSASPTPIATTQNWLLLWYGSNSHFVETKKPLSYSGPEWMLATLPHREAYQADAPILIVFQNAPTSIRQSAEGGVELSFASGAGYFSLLPLLGRDHPRASQTESWAAGLPATILQPAQWWSSHLCEYPLSVSESYAYAPATDTATITEDFSFVTACASGVRFAPVPAMLAVAAPSMGVGFSGTVVDSGLNTEFGPIRGVENVAAYSWQLSGLKRYTDAQRIARNPGAGPAELRQALEAEATKMIAAGHYAPWIFSDKPPTNDFYGDLYWQNPGDSLFHLVGIADALSGPVRAQFINYVRSERTQYPPETMFNMPLDAGKVRPGFSVSGADVIVRWSAQRPEVFSRSVPAFSLYALAGYHALTGDGVSPQLLQRATEIIDSSISEQDWATLYWFDGFDDRPVAVMNANRHFAGLVGYARLAERAANQAAQSRGMALLAKAAVLRVAMASYPAYLYGAGLVELPAGADWQVRYTAGKWEGYVFNNSWVGAADDARQVGALSQFGVWLEDNSGTATGNIIDVASAYLIGYRDLTPELARLLTSYAAAKLATDLRVTEGIFPLWYATFAEGSLGMEHNVQHPVDSFQIFMLKAWAGNPSGDTLAAYADIPWLREGDLFYSHKLAEVIHSYEGTVWDDSLPVWASADDRSATIRWETYRALPSGVTWHVEYTGPTADQPSPIAGLPPNTRTMTMTGLTKYAWYTIRVLAIDSGNAVLTSDPVSVYVTDHRLYQPVIYKR